MAYWCVDGHSTEVFCAQFPLWDLYTDHGMKQKLIILKYRCSFIRITTNIHSQLHACFPKEMKDFMQPLRFVSTLSLT